MKSHLRAILSAITLNDWIKPHFSRFFLKAAYAVLLLVMVGLALNPKYRVRPEEMRRLAPVAKAATDLERRILLYTELISSDALMFQIIWYADRFCDPLPDAMEAIARLKGEPDAAVIMGKEIFQRSIIPAAAASDQSIKILGETERFVCWTMIH